MNQRQTQHIEGDITVGRNTIIGGMATIRNSAKVCHNLTVRGWLDAPNIRKPCVGMFTDEAKLKEYYPAPRPGWWALVNPEKEGSGTTLSADLYVCHTPNEWQNLGTRISEIRLDLPQFYDDVETILRKAIPELHEKLKEETDARIESDKQIKESIQSEITRAEKAEDRLQSAIDNEQQKRTEADADLTDKINEEKHRAELAERNLQHAINNEETSRNLAFQTLENSISSEKSRAESAEENIRQSISNESHTRENSDKALQNEIENLKSNTKILCYKCNTSPGRNTQQTPPEGAYDVNYVSSLKRFYPFSQSGVMYLTFPDNTVWGDGTPRLDVIYHNQQTHEFLLANADGELVPIVNKETTDALTKEVETIKRGVDAGMQQLANRIEPVSVIANGIRTYGEYHGPASPPIITSAPVNEGYGIIYLSDGNTGRFYAQDSEGIHSTFDNSELYNSADESGTYARNDTFFYNVDASMFAVANDKGILGRLIGHDELHDEISRITSAPRLILPFDGFLYEEDSPNTEGTPNSSSYEIKMRFDGMAGVFYPVIGDLIYDALPTLSEYNHIWHGATVARQNIIFQHRTTGQMYVAKYNGELAPLCLPYHFGNISLNLNYKYSSGGDSITSGCLDSAAIDAIPSLLSAIDEGRPITGNLIANTSPSQTIFNVFNVERVDAPSGYTNHYDYKIRGLYFEGTNDNIRLRIIKVVFRRQKDEYWGQTITMSQPVVRQLDFGEFTEAEIDVLFSDEWCQQVDAEQE